MRNFFLAFLISILGLGMSCVPGETLQTVGINSAVLRYDRIADFQEVVRMETSSVDYTEDGLVVSTAPNVLGFFGHDGMIGGYYYPNAGSSTYTSIRTADGIRMRALEFNAGGSGLDGLSYIYWQALVDDTVVSSGTASIVSGDFIGFVSFTGLDELRIAAYFYPEDIEGRTDFLGPRNRIAIDTLRVKVAPRFGPFGPAGT